MLLKNTKLDQKYYYVFIYALLGLANMSKGALQINIRCQDIKTKENQS